MTWSWSSASPSGSPCWCRARCCATAARRRSPTTLASARSIWGVPRMSDPLLQLAGVHAGYGEAAVLDDVSFSMEEGEALALLGRNGMGKTTLLATLMGHTLMRSGSIRLRGRAVERLAPHRRPAAGLGWVPQERDI